MGSEKCKRERLVKKKWAKEKNKPNQKKICSKKKKNFFFKATIPKIYYDFFLKHDARFSPNPIQKIVIEKKEQRNEEKETVSEKDKKRKSVKKIRKKEY